jgi:hypothetical protein
MRPLIALLLVLLVIGLLPVWPYSMAWGVGYWPSGLFGLLLLIIVLMAVLGPRDRPLI